MRPPGDRKGIVLPLLELFDLVNTLTGATSLAKQAGQIHRTISMTTTTPRPASTHQTHVGIVGIVGSRLAGFTGF